MHISRAHPFGWLSFWSNLPIEKQKYIHTISIFIVQQKAVYSLVSVGNQRLQYMTYGKLVKDTNG